MSIRDLSPPRRIPWRSPPRAGSGDLPPITLITPSLNRADLVGMAIESAWAQGYRHLRHIVVDGGSTDGTLAVLARRAEIEVVAQTSRGSHQAMNEALTSADGEVVAFLNTDDVLMPGALRLAGERFAADPALAALRLRAALFEAADDTALDVTGEIVEPPAGLAFDELLFGTPGFNAWFFRRTAVERLAGFDTAFDIGADRDFLLRLHLSGARVVALPVLGYGYRRHPGSRTLDFGAQLRLRILEDHVAIARKALRRRDLARGERRALLDWHGYEAARLFRQRLKQGQILDAARLSLRAGLVDRRLLPLWHRSAAGGRRRGEAVQAAVIQALASSLPTDA